jgi:hypothetical protein
LANRVFELSQALEQKWLTADFPEKRQILEIVFLNLRLDSVTLRYEIREPFDVFAEGLTVLSNRGDWTPIELFRTSLADRTISAWRLL